MTQLTKPNQIRRFILGGNATFTIEAGPKRFTYKVKSAAKDKAKNWSTGNQDKTTYFVSLLRGSSNESDYAYIGLLKLAPIDGFYHMVHTNKSSVATDTDSWQMMYRLWKAIEHGATVPSQMGFWHEGQCCICGRTLTVPESIAKGIGPECEGKM